MFKKEAEEYLTKLLKRLKIKKEDLAENQPEIQSWEKMNFVSLNVSNVSKAFQKGAVFGYNSAIEWFDAKTSVPFPKQLGICRYTIEVVSDKGDMVCYDYKDKCWKKIVIEDEKVTYVPVEIEMWCNKPTKEIE
jgi:hypothetical protein